MSALLFGELKLGGLEVVGELLICTRADYDRGHARSPEQPRERHLRRGHATTLRDLDENVHAIVELAWVVDRWLIPTLYVTPFRGVFIAPVLAREQATRKRAPH